MKTRTYNGQPLYGTTLLDRAQFCEAWNLPETTFEYMKNNGHYFTEWHKSTRQDDEPSFSWDVPFEALPNYEEHREQVDALCAEYYRQPTFSDARRELRNEIREILYSLR